MSIHELIGNQVAAMVEFYDGSAACDHANELVEQVKNILGPSAPVYRINVNDQPREASLVHLHALPTIIIYRNHHEEWRMTSNFPTAQVLAERLTASLNAPGAVNPLKGRHRE